MNYLHLIIGLMIVYSCLCFLCILMWVVSFCRTPLKLLCDNMKYQIISRAFYGCM